MDDIRAGLIAACRMRTCAAMASRPTPPMLTRDQLIDFNSEDPETGTPMIQPMSVTELAHRIKAQTFDCLAAAAAKRRELDSQPKLDAPLDENPNEVGGAKGEGWGVVFHKDEIARSARLWRSSSYTAGSRSIPPASRTWFTLAISRPMPGCKTTP